MRCEFCGGEIDDAKVISHAASLRAKMRRKNAGGRPASLHKCPRCGVECAGRRMLDAHMSLCPAPPLQPVGPEDLIPWTPDAA